MAEQSKLRTAERLTNLLAVLCVVGWRVFWLTMVNRTAPDAPPETVLTAAEIDVLDRMAGDAAPGAEPSSPGTPAPPRTISHYLRAIANLLGDARGVGLLRALHAEAEADRTKRVVRQVLNTGQEVLRAFWDSAKKG